MVQTRRIMYNREFVPSRNDHVIVFQLSRNLKFPQTYNCPKIPQSVRAVARLKVQQSAGTLSAFQQVRVTFWHDLADVMDRQ